MKKKKVEVVKKNNNNRTPKPFLPFMSQNPGKKKIPTLKPYIEPHLKHRRHHQNLGVCFTIFFSLYYSNKW